MNAQEITVLNDLKNDINQLLGFHEETPRINYGPCGAFAKLFLMRGIADLRIKCILFL